MSLRFSVLDNIEYLRRVRNAELIIRKYQKDKNIPFLYCNKDRYAYILEDVKSEFILYDENISQVMITGYLDRAQDRFSILGLNAKEYACKTNLANNAPFILSTGIRRKVLFLDIDGVMNSTASFLYYSEDVNEANHPFQKFCPMAVANLNHLIKHIPDMEIVLSSTWRYRFNTIDKIKTLFACNGIRDTNVKGVTPRTGAVRGLEIANWCSSNGIDFLEDRIAILDDDADMAHLMFFLFNTDSHVGLTFPIVKDLLLYFGYDGLI